MKKVFVLVFVLFASAVLSFPVSAQDDRTITITDLESNAEASHPSGELRLVRYPGDIATTVIPGSNNVTIARFAVQSTLDSMTVDSITINSQTPLANALIKNIRFLQDGVQYGPTVQFSITRDGSYSVAIPVSFDVRVVPTHVWDVVADIDAYATGMLNAGIKKIRVGNGQRVSIYSLPIYGVSHSVLQQPAHVAGTNVQNSEGVWLITDVGTRRKYSSAFAFSTYSFNSVNGILQMSDGDYQLPIGPPILPAEGRVYAQSVEPNPGQVYLISGNMRHSFASVDVFYAMGFSFSSVAGADLSLAGEGLMIMSPNERHPKGTLINAGGEVFYTTAFGKMRIPSITVFNSWGLSFSNVVMATSGDLGLPIEDTMMQPRLPGQLTPR